MTKKTICSWMFSIITLCTVTAAIILLMPFSAFANDQEDKCRYITSRLLVRSLMNSVYENYESIPGQPDYENAKHLNDVADAVVDACESGAASGSSDLCKDVHRTAKENPHDDMPEGDLRFNPQSCNIEDKDGNVLDYESDAPVDPFKEAVFRANYKYAEWLQGRCRQHKDLPTPFDQRAASGEKKDLDYFAQQFIEANKRAIKALEDYLKNYCFKEYLELKASGIISSCGKSGESAIEVIMKLQKQTEFGENPESGPNVSPDSSSGNGANLETFLIRMADWGKGPIKADALPFQLGGDKTSHSCTISGGCESCCTDENFSMKAYAFGGPDQSIIVGMIDDVSLKCDKTEECGSSGGDPHICTHDGLKYDFQGVGEFVLAKTEDFEVQARHKPYGMFASINSAAAVKIKGDRVAVYAGKPLVLTINGVDLDLVPGELINLPGGAVLRRDDSTIRVSYEDYAFEASILNERISSLRVHVPPGSKSGGLLGDRNDNRTDDLRVSDGDFLKAPVAFEDLYGLFGKSWRVTPQTSLFDYADGESTLTFTDLLLPWRRTTFKDLSSSARIRAEEVCREAGIVDRVNMENCIFDVALTGDESFAVDASAQRTGGERLEMKADEPKILKASTADGVIIELPAEGIATYPIEIKVTGNTAKQKLTFAPVGSKPDANPGNPYSAAVLKGGTETVTVRVPYRPGAYELRLLNSRGKNIRLSLPFRSIAPEVRIVAEETAVAGGKIDIRVFGDVSPNTKINIVPAGSADSKDNGVRAILKGGIDETATVSRLPKKAGEYEIRYMSHVADNIYARKKLMIR